MRQLSITPSITVTIGRHTRQYFAFVTTAPAELDSPATVTLHAAPFCGRRRPRGGSGHASTSSAPAHQHAWSSSRRSSSPGSEPSTADISTCCCARTLGSSASTRCSTGCGSACRRRPPVRWLHEPLALLVVVNRSPRMASFSGGHIMVVKIVPNDKAQPARQTRGCRAALHRRRARRLEADRLLRLGAPQWWRTQRHLPGAPVLRQR